MPLALLRLCACQPGTEPPTRRRLLQAGLHHFTSLAGGVTLGRWTAPAGVLAWPLTGARAQAPAVPPRRVDATDPVPTRLPPAAAQALRDWIGVLVRQQLEQGPSPRWHHQDCAGLVRFVVAEALRPHDMAWRRSMGLQGRRLPPDLAPNLATPWRHRWRRAEGGTAAFVTALELVQANTRRVGRQLAQAQAADLLFYDFGDDQHLMLWLGPYVAYHTGQPANQRAPGDTGLRALPVAQLMDWRDTRWRPHDQNPNFVGLHRLHLLG
ncbi:DUF1175 family protein [Ideonella livida]|uniref:DUF1175 family protein n=1 Tax=Ideonella livida TaxID=2707176 RepID=A0A7C9PGH1_9BURK|nr:DUF1175 family protein [Ideonella livida]NDY91293.1 DUF1175 family protein [Ideonella livida]